MEFDNVPIRQMSVDSNPSYVDFTIGSDVGGLVPVEMDDRAVFFAQLHHCMSGANVVFAPIVHLRALLEAFCSIRDGVSVADYVRMKRQHTIGYRHFAQFLQTSKQREPAKSLWEVVNEYYWQVYYDGGYLSYSNSVSFAIQLLKDDSSVETDAATDLLKDLEHEQDAVDLICCDLDALTSADALARLNDLYNNTLYAEQIQDGCAALFRFIQRIHPAVETYKMAEEADHWKRHYNAPQDDYAKCVVDLVNRSFSPVLLQPQQVKLHVEHYFTAVHCPGTHNNCMFDAFSFALFGTFRRSVELRVRAVMDLLLHTDKYLNWRSPCGVRFKQQVLADALSAARRFSPVHSAFVQPLAAISRCAVFGWQQQRCGGKQQFVQKKSFAVRNCSAETRVQLLQCNPALLIAARNNEDYSAENNHIMCLVPLHDAPIVPREYWDSWTDGSATPEVLADENLQKLSHDVVDLTLRPPQIDSSPKRISFEKAKNGKGPNQKYGGANVDYSTDRENLAVCRIITRHWDDSLKLPKFSKCRRTLEQTHRWLLQMKASCTFDSMKEALCAVAQEIETNLACLTEDRETNDGCGIELACLLSGTESDANKQLSPDFCAISY